MDTWLVQLLEHATLDLGAISSSPVLDVQNLKLIVSSISTFIPK